MSKLDKYLDLLNIKDKEISNYKDKVYIVILDNSNDFSRLYTRLDNMDDLDLEESNLSIREEESIFVYSNEEFKITLEANFIKDEYLLIMEEK